MNEMIHVANVIYFFSYAVRSILWLRILTVVAACCLIPYYYCQYNPLLAAICWNTVFIVLNLFQIGWLLWDRRPTRLTPDEQKLHEMVFATLPPRDMLKLLNLAHWEETGANQFLIHQDTEIDDLILLFEGEVEIVANGNRVAEVGAGDFLGEMSFLTRDRTTANVITKTDVRYVVWTRSELKRFLDVQPEMQTAMYSLIGVNLVNKLAGMRVSLNAPTLTVQSV